MKSVQIQSFPGPYFPVFGLNTGKYGPKKAPYLNTFHAVILSKRSMKHLILSEFLIFSFVYMLVAIT